jgi:hypothetical protein
MSRFPADFVWLIDSGRRRILGIADARHSWYGIPWCSLGTKSGGEVLSADSY